MSPMSLEPALQKFDLSNKHGCDRGVALFKITLKRVIRVQNNLEEMVTG